MSNNHDGAQPDKNYVEKYLTQAENTDNEAIRNDCLYRIATQMEIRERDGNTNLSKDEKETITSTAKAYLQEET